MPERAGLPCRPRTSSFGTLVAVSTVLVVLTAPTCASRWQADTSELTEQNGLGRKTTAVGNSETRQQESKGPSGRKLQTRHPYFYPLSDWSMDLNPPSRWKSRPASTRPSQPWNLFRHAVSVSNGRDVLPTLTPRAAAFRRVLIVGLVGGVCSNDDWRGDLPKYIMKFLPEARYIQPLRVNRLSCSFLSAVIECFEPLVTRKAPFRLMYARRGRGGVL